MRNKFPKIGEVYYWNYDPKGFICVYDIKPSKMKNSDGYRIYYYFSNKEGISKTYMSIRTWKGQVSVGHIKFCFDKASEAYSFKDLEYQQEMKF